MPSSKVIELRQVLSGKYLGLRMHLEEVAAGHDDLPAGPPPIGEWLPNRWSKGALNEIVAGSKSSGSATLIREMIHRAAASRQIIGLVDGCDSLDVTQVAGSALAQLLWVRCPDADKALKAADLLLRDGNLPVVMLDLKLNPEAQLRGISPTTWYRFQRLVETTLAVCLVFTPRALVAPAKTRLVLDSHFSLADLGRDADELVGELKMDVAKTAGHKIA